MDLTNIDIDYIETFGLGYTYVKDIFGVEPIDASVKMQKKIRKWIEKNYIGDETYPQEVMQFIGKDVSDETFIKFLKACYDQIQLRDNNKKQLFDKASAHLSQEVKSAICVLLDDCVFFDNIRKVGVDIQIDVECCTSFNQILTLVNATYVPEGKFDSLSFNGSLTKEGDEYILSGVAENYEEDLDTPFAIRFTDAKVDMTIFRADEHQFNYSPWIHLQAIANEILNKYCLSCEYLNDREKELLPLIVEISKLSYWSQPPDDIKSDGFSILKSYIVKFGYKELLPFFESLEKEFLKGNKKACIITKLLSKLNTQKYEPLWRELYNKLVESQANYPSMADKCCNKELLNETRSNIQRFMEFYGYSGKYPDFEKKGTIKGIHLADSYNMSYFVGAKKNVMYYIHCTEEYYDDHLTVQFLCGTEILRKNETHGDIYSCLFNAKGRRFFQTISYETDKINSENLEPFVQIAVKKAELIRLTKKERKRINSDISYWLLFVSVFIFMGGLFGVFMTIGLMIISVIVCLIVAQPQTIPSMFTEIPWWVFFLLAWILFGGAMGIITVLSKRK